MHSASSIDMNFHYKCIVNNFEKISLHWRAWTVRDRGFAFSIYLLYIIFTQCVYSSIAKLNWRWDPAQSHKHSSAHRFHLWLSTTSLFLSPVQQTVLNIFRGRPFSILGTFIFMRKILKNKNYSDKCICDSSWTSVQCSGSLFLIEMLIVSYKPVFCYHIC